MFYLAYLCFACIVRSLISGSQLEGYKCSVDLN